MLPQSHLNFGMAFQTYNMELGPENTEFKHTTSQPRKACTPLHAVLPVISSTNNAIAEPVAPSFVDVSKGNVAK
jgi:hypothetical protein